MPQQSKFRFIDDITKDDLWMSGISASADRIIRDKDKLVLRRAADGEGYVARYIYDPPVFSRWWIADTPKIVVLLCPFS